MIQELETRFRTHGVMDALGIVYTQYRLQVECVTSFPKHLVVIKTTLCSNKTQLLDGVETFVLEVLNTSHLDNQQSMFKLMMKSNAIACMAPPFDTNPLIKMWHFGYNILGSCMKLPIICEIG